MSRQPWVIKAKSHPGASLEEILNEPDWSEGHSHRPGFRNHENRYPGFSQAIEPASIEEIENSVQEAREKFKEIQDKEAKGEMVDFRDVVAGLHDFHLIRPELRPKGWRFVLEATEDWVKYGQDWPANARLKTTSEGESSETKETKDEKGSDSGYDDKESSDGASEMSAQGKSMWKETKYISELGLNNGLHKSPQEASWKTRDIGILQDDQFTPDSWIPRNPQLIRQTGKHPLNAEVPLDKLLEAGLVTPNDLHYVRSHGAVPRLLWEFHQVEVEVGDDKLFLSMDTIVREFPSINIQVLLACDGNRRGELNMVKRTKGFTWGSGAASCAYWRGPLLRDILLAAGQKDICAPNAEHVSEKKLWVNFRGADDLSEGKYETCIPLEYAMDPANDVILAYEMNNELLPADHGYPVRVVIPGYVGGRCVKWLQKIWISDKENDTHYHIWDNRVVPSFVTDIESPEAAALFHNPDMACNEQMLNSVIARPLHGEKILLKDLKKGDTYRVEGFAYNGGGNAVQRVELSTDGGETWHHCERRFPNRPIRHGRKYWTWVFWHVDISIFELVSAKSLAVRAYNPFKGTQPERPIWNIMGMMNSCWHQVKPEITSSDDVEEPFVIFRHPVGVGSPEPGWMKPTMEHDAALVDSKDQGKQITREEVEKHDKDNDCWIVIGGNVYDATSVLAWHPGGKATIMGHAGKVHAETTDEFDGIHDDFARKKLQECFVGRLTEKAIKYMELAAANKAKESPVTESDVGLRKDKWRPAKLLRRTEISNDARTYTFQVPEGKKKIGLKTCQHVEVGFHFLDKMITRQYTPTRPFLPAPETDGTEIENQCTDYDGTGTFELTVKTYFPDKKQPGGAMSNILDMIPIGEEIEIRGPVGEIEYHGNGNFNIDGKDMHFKKISLVLGGSGITPGYSLIARVSKMADDETEIQLVYGNKTEDDILMRDELDEFVKMAGGKFRLTHILSHPSEEWTGLKGHVGADVLRANLFPAADDTVAMVCGPPAMITKSVLPVLKEMGFVEDTNLFGF